MDEQQRMERHSRFLACISLPKHKSMISWRASSKAMWLRGVGLTLNCARSLFRGWNPVIVIFVLAFYRNPALGRWGSQAVPSTPTHVLLLGAQLLQRGWDSSASPVTSGSCPELTPSQLEMGMLGWAGEQALVLSPGQLCTAAAQPCLWIRGAFHIPSQIKAAWKKLPGNCQWDLLHISVPRVTISPCISTKEHFGRAAAGNPGTSQWFGFIGCGSREEEWLWRRFPRVWQSWEAFQQGCCHPALGEHSKCEELWKNGDKFLLLCSGLDLPKNFDFKQQALGCETMIFF